MPTNKHRMRTMTSSNSHHKSCGCVSMYRGILTMSSLTPRDERGRANDPPSSSDLHQARGDRGDDVRQIECAHRHTDTSGEADPVAADGGADAHEGGEQSHQRPE